MARTLMEPPASVVRLKQDICARFPDEARDVTVRVAELGYEPDMLTTWFEQFSQETTEAMRDRNESRVRAHLSFMSDRLATADAAAREYIDVYYVEALMWNLDEVGKKWAWPLVPGNLRDLFIAIWGEPKFVDAE